MLKTNKGLWEAWERNILIFMQDCREMHVFVGRPDRGGRIARRARRKNVEFPAGNCAFLKTEEGLLEAWERKITIFLQENECFCGGGPIVADG